MKAAICTGIKKVEIKEIDKPVITDTEVLIKTKTVGVCGSDLHLFKGTHPFRHAPAILGHEIAGEVVEIGSKVTKVRVGDRVTVEPQVGCGHCEFCRQGLVSLCREKKVPGTPKWIGAFSEYFPAEESIVYPIADDKSFEIGTLAEPFAVAIHAVNHAEHQKGSCVIIGGGSIGQLTLAAARSKGYSPVIVTDTQDFNRQFALDHGADYAFNPLNQDVAEEVKKLTDGKGADIAFVCAQAPGILDQAYDCVHKTGEICIIAMLVEKDLFYAYSIVLNELHVYGSMCYEPKDFKEAVDLINGGLPINDYITQEFHGLEDTQLALDTLDQKKENCVKVVIKVSE